MNGRINSNGAFSSVLGQEQGNKVQKKGGEKKKGLTRKNIAGWSTKKGNRVRVKSR